MADLQASRAGTGAKKTSLDFVAMVIILGLENVFEDWLVLAWNV